MSVWKRSGRTKRSAMDPSYGVDNCSACHSHLDPVTSYVCSCVLLVTGLVGLVGNLLIFVTVYRSKLLQNTNNALIVSLAVSDTVCAAATAPCTIYILLSHQLGSDQASTAFCHYVDSGQVLTSIIQLISLVSISFERYQAIAKPFTDNVVKTRRAKAFISSAWLLGLCGAVSSVFVQNPLFLICRDMSRAEYTNYFTHIFLGPLTYITVVIIVSLYAKILTSLNEHNKKQAPKKKIFPIKEEKGQLAEGQNVSTVALDVGVTVPFKPKAKKLPVAGQNTNGELPLNAAILSDKAQGTGKDITTVALHDNSVPLIGDTVPFGKRGVENDTVPFGSKKDSADVVLFGTDAPIGRLDAVPFYSFGKSAQQAVYAIRFMKTTQTDDSVASGSSRPNQDCVSSKENIEQTIEDSAQKADTVVFDTNIAETTDVVPFGDKVYETKDSLRTNSQMNETVPFGKTDAVPFRTQARTSDSVALGKASQASDCVPFWNGTQQSDTVPFGKDSQASDTVPFGKAQVGETVPFGKSTSDRVPFGKNNGDTVPFGKGETVPFGKKARTGGDTVAFVPGRNKADPIHLVEVVDFDGKKKIAKTDNVAVVGSVCEMNKSNKVRGRQKLEARAAKRASVLIIVFLCCWVPLPTIYLITDNFSISLYAIENAEMVFLTISMMASALNPIMFALTNRQYKMELVKNLNQVKSICCPAKE